MMSRTVWRSIRIYIKIQNVSHLNSSIRQKNPEMADIGEGCQPNTKYLEDFDGSDKLSERN